MLGWIAFMLRPSDEKAVREMLSDLVETVSISPDESGITRLRYADRVAEFFTTNAVISLEGLGSDFPTITSRAELRQTAMAARTHLRQADFDLADVHVTFPPEPRTANAYVVITGTVNFQTNRFGQAFRMMLAKTEGRWRIREIETVERP
ncbi:MAG: nuclear transport factor 2 family protein [Verrucomicrobiia bacterium]